MYSKLGIAATHGSSQYSYQWRWSVMHFKTTLLLLYCSFWSSQVDGMQNGDTKKADLPTSLTDDVTCHRPVICCILRSGLRQLHSVCTASLGSWWPLLCAWLSLLQTQYHFTLLTTGHLLVLKAQISTCTRYKMLKNSYGDVCDMGESNLSENSGFKAQLR